MPKDPNRKNKLENSSGKGWSPPSGQWGPPAAGAHTPVGGVHRVNGGYNKGGDATHSSLKKKK